MSDHSAIEWTGATWNPVTGCTKISAGCAHCYIERQTPMRMAGRRFLKGTTGVLLHRERLSPARVAKLRPLDRPIFVCSMSDLFHEDVPDDFIHSVFQTMEACPDRTFQVLTKRPERALEVMRWLYTCSWCDGGGCAMCEEHDRAPRGSKGPLPNVWFGVTVENARFTWRADVLRQIPAAVRFISAEPLLGSLLSVEVGNPGGASLNRVGEEDREAATSLGGRVDGRKPLDLTGIDWCIIGGESGPGARPLDTRWVDEILDACRAANVAPFVKQLGARPVRSSSYIDGLAYTISELGLRDRKGGNIDEWPERLRVREFPKAAA